jgi:tetratricopeptide (TPR) repeat protein
LIYQYFAQYRVLRFGGAPHLREVRARDAAPGRPVTHRLEDAVAFAGRALTLSRERGQRPFEAWALHLLGEVTARRDLLEEADGHYRDALALAEELKMRPLVAHCHLGLGKLYRRTGRRQEAQKHLVTATTMYREMDMRFWLEQQEAEAGELA